MLLVRSLLFNLFLYMGIIVVFLIAIPTLLLPTKITLIFGKFLGHYVVFVVRIFLNTKVEFKGIENIPKNEKYFVASAHQSMFETFALQAVIPGPIFILKKELIRIPVFGWCLKKIGAVEIVRDTATKENLNFFERILNKTNQSKRPILIFPQGTRVDYKERVPFKKGVGRIYEALKLPCVPVALNTGKIWPKNSFNKYPGNVVISFLNPIEPGLEKDRFIEKLQDNIYKEIDLIG